MAVYGPNHELWKKGDYNKLYLRRKYTLMQQDASIQYYWVHQIFCDSLNWGAYIVSKELNLEPDSFVSCEIMNSSDTNIMFLDIIHRPGFI
jgi:hypothetical protein